MNGDAALLCAIIKSILTKTNVIKIGVNHHFFLVLRKSHISMIKGLFFIFFKLCFFNYKLFCNNS